MRSVPILSKIFVCVYLSIQAQLNHCTCPMEERGWAQNDDGTLKEASEMEWPDSPPTAQSHETLIKYRALVIYYKRFCNPNTKH